MSDQAAEAHTDDHGDDHHGSIGTYIAVFVALCVLTGASFFTYTDAWRNVLSKEAGWTFMMAVSCCKALLVILFFMHLKYEASWKYVLTIPAGLMSIFLVLMLVPDVGFRTNNGIYQYSKERWRDAATPDWVKADQGAEHDAAHGSGDDHADDH